jgi:hypothetical protein
LTSRLRRAFRLATRPTRLIKSKAMNDSSVFCATALVAAAAALAGCASKQPDAAPLGPVKVKREILVQTIPRGAYVERDNEYIGVAPIVVPVDAWEDSGRLLRTVVIRATDTPTGAWTRKVLTPYSPTPERVLLDIRPWLTPQEPMRIGP